jgi:hypothetical protein
LGLAPTKSGLFVEHKYIKKTKIVTDKSLPFVMEVEQNPRVQGVRFSNQALIAAGAQAEFIAANILQANALHSSVILRAGE